ncbi:unnamed protein product [Owenia fusiformis]|uniref:Uncharacterized protein n=1 Tax=Owenia fusiformis TaxID=6347 RepID=A0A8J1TDU8_OWEFU|nr:unnamed protein product [Owenia fusiformis]
MAAIKRGTVLGIRRCFSSESSCISKIANHAQFLSQRNCLPFSINYKPAKSSPQVCCLGRIHTSSEMASNVGDPESDARHLTSFNRKVLVWSGTYKSDKDIPTNVSHKTMKRAQDKMRVKVNFGMMIATVLAAAGFIIWGRKSAKAGDSVVKRSLRWHEEARQEHILKSKLKEEQDESVK